MQILVNGDAFEAPEACFVADLLRAMGLEGQRCAVELNGDIVPRGSWSERRIASGDRLEIVRAIGGG